MECTACQSPNIDGARFCVKCGAPLPAASNAPDPLIGSIVGGRFRISGVLGEGGMGRVYSGDQQMGTSTRKVAVKTLLAEYAKDVKTVERFMRECGTVSELEHPNTVKVYDYGKTDSGDLYIAMELLSGTSLERAIQEGGPMASDRVDKIVGQICGSLQEAHDKGIVHRDLKPANIQLQTRAGETDYVKVLDFGIAKRDEAQEKEEQKLTKQGTILGTPPYMSPEQFKGGALDARSDIYSLAIMAYEMLTGQLPFDDTDSPWEWYARHTSVEPKPFEAFPAGSSVPAKMKAAVMRALAKDREQRPRTVRDFFEEFTLGTLRLSMLGNGAPTTGTMRAAVSAPMGAGQTQIGAPMFSDAALAPRSPTMVDVNAMPASPLAPAPIPASPQAAPTVAPQKSSAGAIVGILVAGVVVAGIVVGGLVWKGRSPNSTDGAGTVSLPTSAPPAAVASESAPSDPPTATPSATVKTTQEPPIKTASQGSTSGGAAAPAQHGSIDACCAALSAISSSGRDAAAKRKAAQAAIVCPGIAKKVKDGAVPRGAGLAQVLSAMTGASAPSECH